jgi:hypothetical protein
LNTINILIIKKVPYKILILTVTTMEYSPSFGGLFYGALSIADDIVSNGRVVVMNWKGFGRKRSWSNRGRPTVLVFSPRD